MVPEEEERKKQSEKIFKEIIVENFPNMGKEIATQVQQVQSPMQDKPKEKHAETHINQNNKNKIQRKKNFKAKKKNKNGWTEP